MNSKSYPTTGLVFTKSLNISICFLRMPKDSHDLWQNLIWMHVNNDNTTYYNFFYQKNDVDQMIDKDLKKLCTVSYTNALF